MEKTFELLETVERGFIFTNLNDFDSKYGHRRDVRGYGSALEELDAMLPASRSTPATRRRTDFTADHGCDPTAPGTDHTREYVPFLHFGPDGGGTHRRGRRARCGRREPSSGRCWLHEILERHARRGKGAAASARFRNPGVRSSARSTSSWAASLAGRHGAAGRTRGAGDRLRDRRDALLRARARRHARPPLQDVQAADDGQRRARDARAA